MPIVGFVLSVAGFLWCAAQIAPSAFEVDPESEEDAVHFIAGCVGFALLAAAFLGASFERFVIS